MNEDFRETFAALLPRVERPVRYTGSELNAITSQDAKAKIVLVFPDTYEIGMSGYGLRVLYHIVNGIPGACAERAFLPWIDMLQRMKHEGIPLHSLESQTPLEGFDMVGITLQNELSYTNALAVLELSGIPLRSAERSKDDPLVVGGGPCAVNPLPLEPFFDAFLAGDGEDAVREMVGVLLETRDRKERLAGFAEISGVWVPALHGRSKKIRRRVVKELRPQDTPVRQVVPTAEVEHDRLVVEIGRGCLRACRFCQAGFTNRPSRCRPLPEILEFASKGISASGWEEVSLLSFAVSDYPYLSELLSRLNALLSPTRTGISLPSFRGEAFNPEMGRKLREIKKTGLTFAPETASPRLKRVINKPIPNPVIIETVGTAASLGWRHVKLYFMAGLPTESPEDMDMNIEFVRELARSVKSLSVNVHVSSFVPKPHTPFQWFAFADRAYLEEAISRFRTEIGLKRVKLKWARPETSFVEALLARGDERLSEVLEGVLQRGGYFQEWSEHFRLESWMEAMEEKGFSPGSYTGGIGLDSPLPWGFIDAGVSQEFLSEEYARALKAETLTDCLSGDCYACGAECKKIESEPPPEPISDAGELRTRITTWGNKRIELRYRIKFAVNEEMRYASHLDLVRAIYRMLRRSGLPLAYSEGFSPHPRVSFGFPKPVGITSRGEYMDVILQARPEADLAAILTSHLPPGLSIIEVRGILPNTPAITKAADILHYEVMPPPASVDKKPDSVFHLTATDGRMSLLVSDARRVKLWDVLASLYNTTPEEARTLDVQRIDAYLVKGARLVTPLEENYS